LHSDIISGLVSSAAPLFLALGNHDGEQLRFIDGTDENMAIWSNYMRKKYFPNPGGQLQSYYAWQWGDALYVVLDPFWNSQRGPRDGGWSWTLGKQQYEWLEKTLAASKARYKMVFLHHLVGGAESPAGRG
jgi:hypothetical protein